jgi:hypothetical protein
MTFRISEVDAKCKRGTESKHRKILDSEPPSEPLKARTGAWGRHENRKALELPGDIPHQLRLERRSKSQEGRLEPE